MDINRLRNELQSGLYDIMSPDESAKVVSQLTEDEIQFGRTQIKSIVKDLKPKFELGVPAIVFINYLRKLLQVFIQTEGVENAVGQQGSVPTNSLLASFADIRAIRANLERLQQAVAQAQRVVYGPERPPSATSTSLVPYNRLNSSIENALFLLPSPEELELLRGNISLRSFVYETMTDIERSFPTETAINNIIRNLAAAGRNKERNVIEDILDSINRDIFLSQEQEDALKQIQEKANAEAAENQQKSEELTIRKESISKNKSGMESKLERQRSKSGGQELEDPFGEDFADPFFGEVVPPKKPKKAGKAGGRKVESNRPEKQVAEIVLPEEEEDEETMGISPLEIPKYEIPQYYESKFKEYNSANKRLSEGDEKKLDEVEYKPITRKQFEKFTMFKKEAYIAKAVMKGDIEGRGYVNELDPDGVPYNTILTPKLLLAHIKVPNSKTTKPRFTATELIRIFDKYLGDKALTEEEPIQEFSGTPAARSVISQNTPAGVASTFAPQGIREKKGRGIRGRGLQAVKNRVEGRIEREPEPRSAYSFAPFGRYIINTNKLQKGILSINSKTGKSLPRLKSKIITKALTQIFKEIAKGNEITNEKTDELTDDEIDTLYNTHNECHLLSKYNTPTSQDMSKTESELNRFLILKGQISAGQNNKDVVREFKALLLKYIKKGQIPKSEGYDILEELLVLGY
jgi:hypothetical protein